MTNQDRLSEQHEASLQVDNHGSVGGAQRREEVSTDLPGPALYNSRWPCQNEYWLEKMSEAPLGHPGGHILLKVACVGLELRAVWH